jgi:putative addiction module component (TIGR02574 family)
MSVQQIEREALALSLAERVALAQALWESIDAGLDDADEGGALIEAIRRDEDLTSGAVSGRTHEQVMQTARRAIGCD